MAAQVTPRQRSNWSTSRRVVSQTGCDRAKRPEKDVSRDNHDGGVDKTVPQWLARLSGKRVRRMGVSRREGPCCETRYERAEWPGLLRNRRRLVADSRYRRSQKGVRR